MKKSILMAVAALGCNALVAQTTQTSSDPIVIPSPAALPAQTAPSAPYQPSMGSNTLEVVTPTGTEVISPEGTEIISNPPTTTISPMSPVTPNSGENNPAGINNATPNLSLPQNPTQ